MVGGMGLPSMQQVKQELAQHIRDEKQAQEAGGNWSLARRFGCGVLQGPLSN